MLRFLLLRLGLVVPTFVGATLVSFAFIRVLPGDPILLLAGERGIDPARHAQLMQELGFDLPIWVQYFRYLDQLLDGDLGRSIITRNPVAGEFLALFPATLELSLAAILFAVLVGLPAGVVAAVRRGRATDFLVMAVSLTGYSMPIFWLGLMMIIFFSVTLGLTPVSGRISVLYFFEPVTGLMLIDSLLSGQAGAFRSALSHLVLPAICLGTVPMAVIARQTRSAMLDVLGEDYVRTARAKGLPPWRVVGVHALRNALIPVVTVIGLQVGVLLGGAILTETIFSWPGIGKWMVDSIFRRDYPAVQGGLFLIALVVIVVNLVVDLLYGLINPRIRHGR